MTLPKPTPREPAAPKPIPRRAVDRRARRAKRRAKVARLPRIGGGTHGQKVRKANELWRHLIYAKEPSGICPRCKVRRWHDAAHFFTKGAYPAMRFELDNAAPVCRVCHRRIDSDHKAKLDFALAYLGAERYARLELMSQGRGKCDMDLTILFLQNAQLKLERDRAIANGPRQFNEGFVCARDRV